MVESSPPLFKVQPVDELNSSTNVLPHFRSQLRPLCLHTSRLHLDVSFNTTISKLHCYCLVTLSLISVACVTAWTSKSYSPRTPCVSNIKPLQPYKTYLQKNWAEPYRFIRSAIHGAFHIEPTRTWCSSIDYNMDTGICDGSTGAAITREQQAELMYKGKKYVLMPIPERGTVSTHAIHGTLFKKCCIERYDVYRREQNTIKAAATTTSTDTEQVVPSQVPESAGADVVAVVTLGSNLDGHNNIVHGGVLALVIDDVLGFGYFAVLLQEDEELRLGKNTSINDGTTAEAFRSNVIAVTANLNINYRAPVPSNSTVVVEATLVRNVESAETRREKNKFHWNVEVVSLDCATTYCQATSLYVIPKKQL